MKHVHVLTYDTNTGLEIFVHATEGGALQHRDEIVRTRRSSFYATNDDLKTSDRELGARWGPYTDDTEFFNIVLQEVGP